MQVVCESSWIGQVLVHANYVSFQQSADLAIVLPTGVYGTAGEATVTYPKDGKNSAAQIYRVKGMQQLSNGDIMFLDDKDGTCFRIATPDGEVITIMGKQRPSNILLPVP